VKREAAELDDDSDDDVPLKPAKKVKSEAPPAADKKKAPVKKGLASSMPFEMAATASKPAILCQVSRTHENLVVLMLALITCPSLQSGDAKLDLKGDIGAVGRIKVDRKAETALQIDLNGVEYDGNFFTCNSMCVVSVGTKTLEDGSKIDVAKVETVLNDMVNLMRKGDVFGKESTLHGTTAGYDIDDDDDGGFKGFRKGKGEDDGDDDKGKKKTKKAGAKGKARK